jgi:hypothetical protein
MAFPAYTNTYALFSKNPALATWWGTQYTDFVITFRNFTAPFYHYLYFKIPAISKYDVKIVLKKINLSIATSIPTPVQVEDYESIPDKGDLLGGFLTGTSLYYSVVLSETSGFDAWSVRFWNLPYTIYTSYINSTINQNKYNFDIYAIRQTTASNIVFTDGSALQASDLNLFTTQSQYIAEEADQHFLFSSTPSADLALKYDKIGGAINGNVSINGTLQSSGLITAQSGINISNQKISNLATPTQNNDAVTKEYVDNAVGSGGVFEVLNDSITTAKLDKTANSQAVTTETIKDGAVTNSKIDSVDGTKIINGTISPVKLATPLNLGNALSEQSIYRNDGTTPLGEFNDLLNTRRPVTTNSIRTSAITTAKIASGAITTDKLNQTAGSQAVTTEAIRDLAVTNSKIANGTIGSEKLNPNFTFNGATGTFQNLTATNFTFSPTNFVVNQDWSIIANSPINHLGVVTDAYMGLRRNADGTTAFSIYPYTSGESGLYTNSIVQLKEFQSTSADSWMARKSWKAIKFNWLSVATIQNFSLTASSGKITFDAYSNNQLSGVWHIKGFVNSFVRPETSSSQLHRLTIALRQSCTDFFGNAQQTQINEVAPPQNGVFFTSTEFSSVKGDVQEMYGNARNVTNNIDGFFEVVPNRVNNFYLKYWLDYGSDGVSQTLVRAPSPFSTDIPSDNSSVDSTNTNQGYYYPSSQITLTKVNLTTTQINTQSINSSIASSSNLTKGKRNS